jgi:manganese transport protein
MPKMISTSAGISSVLLWSVISAAFIGPGTITSCMMAGSQFGSLLIWALSFSILATILLQELIARINMATQKSLGELIAIKYQQNHFLWSKILFLAVTFGCAAYEMGNIMGAVQGLRLFIPIPSWILVMVITSICFIILKNQSVDKIAKYLASMVFIMGISFVYLVFQMDVDWTAVLAGAIFPRIPDKSGTLLIALIGTTIVPYNLFLGAGIRHQQTIWEMRWGIGIAVLMGGLISIFILLAGQLLQGPFSFQNMYQFLDQRYGKFSAAIFGIGLFAAGLSSAITAPLAAAICGESMFGSRQTQWLKNKSSFNKTWMIVLAVGCFFSLTRIQPIPAIILAQGINGLLLPLVCVAMYLVIQDKNLLSPEFSHPPVVRYVYLGIIGITGFLGIYNIQKAILRIIPSTSFSESKVIWVSALLSLSLIVLIQHDTTHRK